MRIIIIMLILLYGYCLSAKSVEGWVYDKENKDMSLIGVNVYWSGTNIGTATDVNGYFKLDKKEENHMLVFSYVGFKNDTVLVFDTKALEVFLTAGSSLNQINVVERVNPTSISSINPILTQNITSKELNKFACCNLSESFETNASVDVSYADAVSGIKQIKMLGLSGRYSQLMLENIPIIRGSETAFGLNYIPGTWMKSIQVSKGTAAVKNGYESVTGQINVNYHDPDSDEKLQLYMYGNQDGKVELNAGIATKVGEKWGTNLLIATGANARKMDMNGDYFMDKPTSYLLNVMSRWNYKGKNVEAKLGISAITEKLTGGQMDYDHEREQSQQSAYGIGIDVNRVNAFSKIGFLFSRPKTSIGWISSANLFERRSFYGHNILDVDQLNLYTNLIFQTYIYNTQHTFNTGVSLNYDNIYEYYNSVDEGFVEAVPGMFAEYNYLPAKHFSLLLGLRYDHSNLHGGFVTPRVHAKYSLPKYTTFRVSAGKGYRTPSIVSENTQYLATSKTLVVHNNVIQEEAWNYGFGITNELPVNGKDLTLAIEFFRTDFQNQLVVDLEQNSQEIHFDNLNGESYAHSLQFEAFYELFKRFDLTAGFRFNDVKTEYSAGLNDVPFISRYKGLLSAQYRTNLDKWQLDATIQFHGQQRLLNNSGTLSNGMVNHSDDYINIIAQITKNYKFWSFYVGAENLTDFIQEDAIIGADNPFGASFDASQVWGPVYGRMFYVGIKYKLKK